MKNHVIVKDGIPTLQASDLSHLQGYRCIDVRSSEEYEGELGHIQGTELVTLGDDLEDFLNQANQDESYVFICRSGARSARATFQAMNLGFKKVYNLEGGMILWNEHKLPVVR
jgi:rhodanese-related sulfurtransferase